MSDSLQTPWTIACQTTLAMGFPRQEYWSGLPFPSPGDLPNPGIRNWVSCITSRFFTLWATREVDGILFSHKKEWTNAICSNMDDLEFIILSEVSQRERQIPCDFTYIWNPKYDTNESIYKTETDSGT